MNNEILVASIWVLKAQLFHLALQPVYIYMKSNHLVDDLSCDNLSFFSLAVWVPQAQISSDMGLPLAV